MGTVPISAPTNPLPLGEATPHVLCSRPISTSMCKWKRSASPAPPPSPQERVSCFEERVGEGWRAERSPSRLPLVECRSSRNGDSPLFTPLPTDLWQWEQSPWQSSDSVADVEQRGQSPLTCHLLSLLKRYRAHLVTSEMGTVPGCTPLLTDCNGDSPHIDRKKRIALRFVDDS